MSEIDRQYLRVRDVAEQLKLDESTVYKMVKARTLPSIRMGKAVRIPAGGLLAYLERVARDGQPLVTVAPIDPAELGSVDARALEFHQRVGRSPHEFVDGWKSGAIPDTDENAPLALEALALRAALDRTPVSV